VRAPSLAPTLTARPLPRSRPAVEVFGSSRVTLKRVGQVRMEGGLGGSLGVLGRGVLV
jgi:hypothetical protein